MIQKIEPEARGLSVPLSQTVLGFDTAYVSPVSAQSSVKPEGWLRSHRPEIIIYLSILACILEGALRKWVFGGSSSYRYLCYFSKDILFGALIITTWPRISSIGSDSLRKFLTFGILLTVLGAILARALFVLPVLGYLALSRIGGIKLEGIALLIGLLTFANAALGIKQYYAPPDALINAFASDTMSAVSFQGSVRAAGTFSFITGYGNMATVGAWAGLTLLCIAAGRLRYIVAGWAIYAAAVVCALVSISRGTVIIIVLSLAVFVFSGRDALGNVTKAMAGLAMMFLVGYAFDLNPKVANFADKLVQRMDESSDTFQGRTLDPITEIGSAFEIAPMGQGFGTEQVAGVYARTGVMDFQTFEGQFSRIVLETGILGFAGFLVTCIGALCALFTARSDCSTEGLRRVCILTMFLLGTLFSTNVVFNHTASFFAWSIFAVTIAATSARSEAAVASHG